MVNALRKLVGQLLQSKSIEACLHENEKNKKSYSVALFDVMVFHGQIF